MTAQITTDKGGGPQVGSMRLTGAEVDAVTPVTFANFDNTGVNGWKWEIIDAPAQSPSLNPIPAPVFTPTTAITHDVKGHSILVRLTTYVDVARTIIDDIDQVVLDARFDPPFDWVIPAAGQSLEVDDIRGWASDVNRILREVNAFMATGGGAGGSIAWKDSVRFVTTSDIPGLIGEGTRVGNTITANANGAMPVIDGVTPQLGDSLLYHDAFFNPEDNGIYVIDDLGSAGSPWVITRRDDMNTDDEVRTQCAFMVEEGTRFARCMVTLRTEQPITLNIDGLDFDFNSVGEYHNHGPAIVGTVEARPWAMHEWAGSANAQANLPQSPPDRCRVAFFNGGGSSDGQLTISENGTGRFIDGPTGNGLTFVRFRGRGLVELQFDAAQDRWKVTQGAELVLWDGQLYSIQSSGQGAFNHRARVTFGTNTVLARQSGNTGLIAKTIAEDRLLGRLAGQDLTDLTVAQVQTLLGVVAGGISANLFDANTILAADLDNTPTARVIGTQQLVGRNPGGNIQGITFGAGQFLHTSATGQFTGVNMSSNSFPYRDGAGNFGDLTVGTNRYIRNAGAGVGFQDVADGEFLGRPVGGNLGVITEAQAKTILGGPAADDFVTQAELATVASGQDWQDSVLDKDLVTAPGAPTPGDRYIIAGTGGGWSLGTINDIAEWDGAAWQFTTPTEGMATTVEDENVAYIFNGASWVLLANYTGAVVASSYDANTILKADVDNTPIALTVPEQTLVGRITAGNITSLTAAQVRTLLNVADADTIMVMEDFTTAVDETFNVMVAE